MIRIAHKLKLKPGCAAEYAKRHDEVWPELCQELSAAGISDFTIFLDEETNCLFAFRKLSENNTTHLLRESPVVRKWWAFMADIMETHPDLSPLSVPLKEVFHLD